MVTADVSKTGTPYRILLPALAIVFLSSLDLTVIAPVLPTVLSDLSINTAEADRYVWIVTGYLTAYIAAIPIVGRLSDVAGRRACLLGSVLLFLAGSIVCAFADGLPILISGRVLQGLGGGAILPVTLALAGDLVPPNRRGPVIGIIAAAETLGWVLGPIWGAGILSLFDDWRWIFLLNVPIGVAAIGYLATTWSKMGLLHNRGVRFDWLGSIFLVISLVTINLALATSSEGQTTVSSDSLPLGADPNPLADYRVPLLLVGTLSVIAFILVQRRVNSPLIPGALVTRRNMLAANLSNLGAGVGLMAVMVNVPVMVALLTSEARVSTVSAQLLAAFSLAMAVGSLIGGRLTTRVRTLAIGSGGLLLAAGALASMIFWPDRVAYTVMIPSLVFAGAGLGLLVAPLNSAALDAANSEELGIASGSVIVSRLVGMTVGISLLSSWATNRIQQQIRDIPQGEREEGETLAEFFGRQEQLVLDYAIPITLDILRDTFLVSAVICLIAIIPVLFIRDQARQRRTATEINDRSQHGVPAQPYQPERQD